MHELFLTTSIPNEDLGRSLRVLQGYCAMSPVSLLRRRLVWEGPRSRQLTGIDPAFIARQGPKQVLWRGLHEQLSRQSYVITLIYDVDPGEFGKAGANGGEDGLRGKGKGTKDCDQLPGALRWTDLPDPGASRPVNSRLIVNIENEKGLCTTLKNMGHTFKREIIQECYRFVHGNVVFDISRYLEIPEAVKKSMGSVGGALPDYETLRPFDAENKWILMASVGVVNGNDPEMVKMGTDDLLTIKTEFEGCF